MTLIYQTTAFASTTTPKGYWFGRYFKMARNSHSHCSTIYQLSHHYVQSLISTAAPYQSVRRGYYLNKYAMRITSIFFYLRILNTHKTLLSKWSIHLNEISNVERSYKFDRTHQWTFGPVEHRKLSDRWSFGPTDLRKKSQSSIIGFKCKEIDYKMSKLYRIVPMIRVEPARVKKYKLIK